MAHGEPGHICIAAYARTQEQLAAEQAGIRAAAAYEAVMGPARARHARAEHAARQAGEDRVTPEEMDEYLRAGVRAREAARQIEQGAAGPATG